MRKTFLLLLSVVCIGCTTGPRAPGPEWADASIIAKQRKEIAELKRELSDMERTQSEVRERIERITAGLTDSIERGGSLQDIFAAIDGFVTDLISENDRLRGLQQPNSGADAGKG